MWIIDNSQEVLKIISNISKPRNICTFDFSTLYTSIPHGKLKNKLNGLIRQSFTGMGFEFIKLPINSNAKASWARGMITMSMPSLLFSKLIGL